MLRRRPRWCGSRARIHDVTCRNSSGPRASQQESAAAASAGRCCFDGLHAQRARGDAYAIIGGVGPAKVYAKTVGAIAIPGWTPGVYGDMLTRRPPDRSRALRAMEYNEGDDGNRGQDKATRNRYASRLEVDPGDEGGDLEALLALIAEDACS